MEDCKTILFTIMREKGVKTENLQVCNDCGHGTYDYTFANLSINKEPTLVICPFSKYKKNLKEKGCEKWIPKKD